MISVLKADDRFHTRTAWLDSWHTFSFADHYDPDRARFRALRVINDATVEAGQDFGSHPHRDMQTVTYVAAGGLSHRDSSRGGRMTTPRATPRTGPARGGARRARRDRTERTKAVRGRRRRGERRARRHLAGHRACRSAAVRPGVAPSTARAQLIRVTGSVLAVLLAVAPHAREGQYEVDFRAKRAVTTRVDQHKRRTGGLPAVRGPSGRAERPDRARRHDSFARRECRTSTSAAEVAAPATTNRAPSTDTSSRRCGTAASARHGRAALSGREAPLRGARARIPRGRRSRSRAARPAARAGRSAASPPSRVRSRAPQ